MNKKATIIVCCAEKMGGEPRTPKNCLKGMSLLQPGTPKGAAMVPRNGPQAQAHTRKGRANPESSGPALNFIRGGPYA